jgi:antirestriction protein
MNLPRFLKWERKLIQREGIEMAILSIYLTNLAQYNAGRLIGEWIELPIAQEELEERIKKILGRDEEYFITDSESDIGWKVGEYEDPYKLNEQAGELDEFENQYDEEVLGAFIDHYSDMKEALEALQSGDFTIINDVEDEDDLGYEAVDQGFFGIEIPDNLKNYIDYEKIGRDMTFEGWEIFRERKIAICFY